MDQVISEMPISENEEQETFTNNVTLIFRDGQDALRARSAGEVQIYLKYEKAYTHLPLPGTDTHTSRAQTHTH